MKLNLFGMFDHEIADIIAPLGLPKYKAVQIAQWMYQKSIYDFHAMTNLSLEHRKILLNNFTVKTVSLAAKQTGADNLTHKFLLSYPDGEAVETVLMKHSYGNSVCVSTQIGCAMGCVFCASTINGMVRNLTGGEILAQVIYVNEMLGAQEESVNTIVIMGSGEPLANYDNVLRFIRLCHDVNSINLSYRSVTLSTSGLVPGILALAEEGIPVNLSISLHAPNNLIRSKLMPINKKYPIETVLSAADHYAKTTGRRITYEYTLIAGINDRPEHARQLAQLLEGRLASVNIIPVNPVVESQLNRPSNSDTTYFVSILKNHNVNVTVRREMGTDIQAACGQLRNRTKVIKIQRENS